LHGFLSYLVKVNVSGGTYRVFGYGGKQVRDNIHAHDVARFAEEFIRAPRSGEVYNCGGGRDNSCSILEAFAHTERRTGNPMKWEYVDKAREGDHICYISDLGKMRRHYPHWDVTRSLEDLFDEITDSWLARLNSNCSLTTA
jgi:CDP-paratose 2-epimerase